MINPMNGSEVVMAAPRALLERLRCIEAAQLGLKIMPRKRADLLKVCFLQVAGIYLY